MAESRLRRKAAIQRADHIMRIHGHYIDGRMSKTGAQYINASLGKQGYADNARFAGKTGAIRVTKRTGIRAGEEIKGTDSKFVEKCMTRGTCVLERLRVGCSNFTGARVACPCVHL